MLDLFRSDDFLVDVDTPAFLRLTLLKLFPQQWGGTDYRTKVGQYGLNALYEQPQFQKT